MATTITLTAKPRKNVVPNVPARIAAPPKTDMTKATPWLGKKCSTAADRSEEHTSELQSLMRNSYAVYCFNKTRINKETTTLIVEHNTDNPTHLPTVIDAHVSNTS